MSIDLARIGVRNARDTVSISFEVDGSSGSTECEAWQAQREAGKLIAAGYTVVSACVIARSGASAPPAEFKPGDRVYLARTVGQTGATGTVTQGSTQGWPQVAVQLDPPHGERVGIYEAWPDRLDIIEEEKQA